MNNDLIRSEQLPFLPLKTELLVSVNIEQGVAPGLTDFLESNSDHKVQPQRNCYVRVQLLQDLLITFRLFGNGNIKRELEGCRCFIPALPDEEIYSLNQAYQKISAAFEPNRTSVGGRIYDNFYFMDADGVWRLLDEKREEVYRPYRESYEKVSREIKEKKVRDTGVSLPRGSCLIIRRECQNPFLAYPTELSHLIGVNAPYDQDEKLITFGPFPEDEIWNHVNRLEEAGFIYGKDFVYTNLNLPEWARVLLLPV